MKKTYKDLAHDLEQSIASGQLALGSLLPTEFELCEEYGVSRYTVRMALQMLQDLGLISRTKNVGTRVEALQASSGFTQSIATVDELAQFGASHVRYIHRSGIIVTDSELAATMGCRKESHWLRISSLRMSGDKKSHPLCWTDVYIDPAFSDIPDLAQASPKTLISALIETRYKCRIARIQQEISAISVNNTALIAALKVEENTPALKIVRRYFDSMNKAFEISVSVHPADRFVFAMQMDRSAISSPA